MSGGLSLRLGDKADLDWGQAVVTDNHYLHAPVHRKSRPMIYVAEYAGERIGLCIVGLPHATKKRGWWGYEGYPTQWQVVDMSRIWLSPDVQRGGDLCRPDIVPGFVDRKGIWWPAVATWLIKGVLNKVQKDRVSMWPPVFIHQPYHILLAISYHDPRYHRGEIYRQSGAKPVYVDERGQSIPGPNGKHLWAWELPNPDWDWQDIYIRKPRTLRMVWQ